MKHIGNLRAKRYKDDPDELNQLNREELQSLIDEQLDLPWRKIDYGLLRQCYALLDTPQQDTSEAQRIEDSLLALRLRIKEEGERKTKQSQKKEKHSGLKRWRVAAATAMTLSILFVFPLMRGQPFRSGTSHDGQGYIVMGIQQSNYGEAQADISNRQEDEDFIILQSLSELPSHFSYAIALPGWLPEGCEAKEIAALRTTGMDTLDIIYGFEDKQVRFTFTHNRDIAGTGSYYEQDREGKTVKLDKGADIYLASNKQSIWALYQADRL